MQIASAHPLMYSVFASYGRGRGVLTGAAMWEQPLPTDSIGLCNLTLLGVVAGSVIYIETLAGTPVASRTASSASELFSVPAYAVGSANNNLRIKVRKGSAAPFYQPYETQATASVGAQSIFVSQIPD